MAGSAAGIQCREIVGQDIGDVVDLLRRGFPRVRPQHWTKVMQTLVEHRAPEGLPQYGYVLVSAGVPVGVLLVIFSMTTRDATIQLRGNVSSWYVDPRYRLYGPLLSARALAHPGVTYLNISSAPQTRPILERQGYRLLTDKQFFAAAALSRWPRGARLQGVRPGQPITAGLSKEEHELLCDHARYGCISVVCKLSSRVSPFVFVRRRRYRCLPCAELVYCRSVDEFAECAGPVGGYLAVRGMPLVVLDAESPLANVPGRIASAFPKFYKGAHPPRLGDLTYTERSMFGF
jgi:hypothetical protein